MSALPNDQTFNVGARYVPVPPNLASLLRPEDPGRHWAAVLRRIFGKQTTPHYDQTQRADCKALCELLAKNCTSPDIVEHVVRLLPLQPCQYCGKPFLAEQHRRAYCSQRCMWAEKRRRASEDGVTETCRKETTRAGSLRITKERTA